MNTEKKSRSIYLVLVPHRDIRQKVQKYSDSLVKNSFTGIYTFPCVAPLASLSQPLNNDELKHFAHFLREATGWGKITAAETAFTPFPSGTDDMALFGPCLDINISEFFTQRRREEEGGGNYSSKIITLFSPIVIGTCLIPEYHKQQLRVTPWLNPLELSFRAAAVANMSWQPVQIDGEAAFKWKIGKLSWLQNK